MVLVFDISVMLYVEYLLSAFLTRMSQPSRDLVTFRLEEVRVMVGEICPLPDDLLLLYDLLLPYDLDFPYGQLLLYDLFLSSEP